MIWRSLKKGNFLTFVFDLKSWKVNSRGALFKLKRKIKKLWLEKVCYIFSIKISLENSLYIVTWYDCWFILLNRLSCHGFKKQIFCPKKYFLNPRKRIFSNYNRAFFLIYNNFFYAHPAFFLSSVVFLRYLDNILLMNF